MKNTIIIDKNHGFANSLQKITKITLVVTATSLVLTACSIPPQQAGILVAKPYVNFKAPYNTSDSRTISSDQQESIAKKGWQEFYTDAKLKQLISIALANNKDLKSALLAIEKSRTQYQLSQNNQTVLGSNLQYSRSKNRATRQPATSRFNLALAVPSYELDLWGKLQGLEEQALNNYLASNAGKENARIILISNVAQSYVSLSYAKAQYKLAQATVESREKSLFLLQKRFEAGVDSKTPSLQAKASLESAKIALYNAQTSIQKLKNALQILLGSPLPEQFEPPAGITKITSEKVLNAGLPSDLLLNRPDILQAELQLRSAGGNIKVARSAYFPSISLTGQYGSTSGKLLDLFTRSATGWSFAPSINVPIFDAGKRDANYKMAELQQQQALINYEKKIQTAFKEVADILAERATLQKRLNSQYQLQASFNETFNIAEARFKTGLSSYLGVLDAQRSKFATQQSILQLEQSNLLSQIQLYQVLGGGLSFDSSFYEQDETVDDKPTVTIQTKQAILSSIKADIANIKANKKQQKTPQKQPQPKSEILENKVKIAPSEQANHKQDGFKPLLKLSDLE